MLYKFVATHKWWTLKNSISLISIKKGLYLLEKLLKKYLPVRIVQNVVESMDWDNIQSFEIGRIV